MENARQEARRVWLLTPACPSSASTQQALGLGAERLGEILHGESLRPLSAPQPARDRRDARAWANEILHAAKLSPYALSSELGDEEVARLAAAMDSELERGLELREAGASDEKTYRVHRKLGEPCYVCGTPLAQVDFETTVHCPTCQTGSQKSPTTAGLSRLPQVRGRSPKRATPSLAPQRQEVGRFCRRPRTPAPLGGCSLDWDAALHSAAARCVHRADLMTREVHKWRTGEPATPVPALRPTANLQVEVSMARFPGCRGSWALRLWCYGCRVSPCRASGTRTSDRRPARRGGQRARSDRCCRAPLPRLRHQRIEGKGVERTVIALLSLSYTGCQGCASRVMPERWPSGLSYTLRRSEGRGAPLQNILFQRSPHPHCHGR